MSEFISSTIGMLVIFTICSLVNVILNTMKSIVTVKGTTFAAANMNMVTFGFYTLVLKQIANMPLEITVPVVMITNFIGVYFASWILKTVRKDRLWRISATVKENRVSFVEHALASKDIKFNKITASNHRTIFDIFSQTQGESFLIKEILQENNAKYHIIEIEKSL